MIITQTLGECSCVRMYLTARLKNLFGGKKRGGVVPKLSWVKIGKLSPEKILHMHHQQ